MRLPDAGRLAGADQERRRQPFRIPWLPVRKGQVRSQRRTGLLCPILCASGARMVHLLQRHTLPIKAQLRASLVLAYAIPADVLRPMLAPGLALDTYGDVGFLAIALVETRDLRPAFLPAGLGLNFFLAGYQIRRAS